MTVKKLFGKLHLWFGLASGLVLFIMCITAAIWAFSPEMESLTQSFRHVKSSNAPFLPVSVLKTKADAQMKGHKANRLYFYGRDKSAVAEYYGDDYYYAVYLNPYTGEVLKVRNEGTTFFRMVIIGHYTLWLGDVGRQIVRWSTVVFLFMLISGIVLWWPKNKAARKQRFKIKLGTSPKRLNYDLHNVLGFYASWIILFAALTGIVWTFDWAAKTEFFVASGGAKDPGYSNPVIKKQAFANDSLKGMDSVYAFTLASHTGPLASSSISFPDTDSAALVIQLSPSDANYDIDATYFNPYTFKQIPVAAYGQYKDDGPGIKAARMNYDIHIGSIFGLPGRIAMFLAVLIGASLPITGFYIWWGKNNKKKTKPAAAKQKSKTPA